MRDAAAKEGIALEIASGFRGFERQMAIWNKKARGEALLLDAAEHPIEAGSLAPQEQYSCTSWFRSASGIFSALTKAAWRPSRIAFFSAAVRPVRRCTCTRGTERESTAPRLSRGQVSDLGRSLAKSRRPYRLADVAC
jgi:hypothetical protein